MIKPSEVYKALARFYQFASAPVKPNKYISLPYVLSRYAAGSRLSP
jgi:hypothetical protein